MKGATARLISHGQDVLRLRGRAPCGACETSSTTFSLRMLDEASPRVVGIRQNRCVWSVATVRLGRGGGPAVTESSRWCLVGVASALGVAQSGNRPGRRNVDRGFHPSPCYIGASHRILLPYSLVDLVNKSSDQTIFPFAIGELRTENEASRIFSNIAHNRSQLNLFTHYDDPLILDASL